MNASRVAAGCSTRGHTTSALLGLAALLMLGGAAALAAPYAGRTETGPAGRGIMLRQAGLLCVAHSADDECGLPCFAIADASPNAWFAQFGRH